MSTACRREQRLSMIFSWTSNANETVSRLLWPSFLNIFNHYRVKESITLGSECLLNFIVICPDTRLIIILRYSSGIFQGLHNCWVTGGRQQIRRGWPWPSSKHNFALWFICYISKLIWISWERLFLIHEQIHFNFSSTAWFCPDVFFLWWLIFVSCHHSTNLLWFQNIIDLLSIIHLWYQNIFNRFLCYQLFDALLIDRMQRRASYFYPFHQCYIFSWCVSSTIPWPTIMSKLTTGSYKRNWFLMICVVSRLTRIMPYSVNLIKWKEPHSYAPDNGQEFCDAYFIYLFD